MNADGTCAPTEARPSFPWPLQHTNTRDNRKIWPQDRPVPINYDVPMDWHHMVPWNVLRNGWSALATSQQYQVLDAWIGLLSVDDSAARLDELRGGTLSTTDALSLTEKMCWAKWNLVEGPNNTNRTDDPGGDAFDNFAGKKFSSNLSKRSQSLNQIYTKLRNWPATKADVSDEDAKLLKAWFAELKVAKSSPIPMFEGKAWAVVDAGKIDKFGSGTPPNGRHATWKKA